MLLYTLIDQNDPRCLYCGKACKINSDADIIPFIGLVQTSNIYTCYKCNEYIEICSLNDEVFSFIFTCHGIAIHQDYDRSEPSLGIENDTGDDYNENEIVWVPEFKIDFSDKDALYQKIKTYLTFS